MKNLIELKQERASNIEAMEAIIKKAQDEKRDVGTEEQTDWDARNAKIKVLDGQIEMLERQEDLNKKIAKKQVESPEKKLAKRFDLFKAIREVQRGLSGAELEVVQEGIDEFKRSGVSPDEGGIYIPSALISIQKRAYAEVDTTAGVGYIPTDVSDVLSIVRTPILLDKLGVTIYNDLKGNLKLPKLGQLTATFVAEKSAVEGAGTTPGYSVLAPRRVGAGDRFSKELFSQTSMSLQNGIMQDFMDSIWRAIQKDLFEAVAAGGTIPSAYEITDTVAALTHATILALEAAIETDYEPMAWVMSRGQRALLKALKLDTGSAEFAWKNGVNGAGEVNGYSAHATSSIVTNGGSTYTAFDVIFGFWKAAVVGQWGGIELIVDPYTYAAEGEYKITSNGLFDTAVANALHFAVARNANA